MKLIKKIWAGTRKLLVIKDHPASIAKGFALGSFMGMMPIPGFQMIVSLGIASLFRINKKAACIGVFNTNVFTGAFLFAFNYWLGKSLLGIQTTYHLPEKIGVGLIKNILDAGSEVFLSMLLGGLVTGVFLAILSFMLIRRYLETNTMKALKS